MMGGVHGRGVCGRWVCLAGGCVWQGAWMAGGAWQGVHGRRGMCGGGWHAWQILRDTVNKWAVRILLECILVSDVILRVSMRTPNVTHVIFFYLRIH